MKKDLGKRIIEDVSAKIGPYEFNHIFSYNCDCCNKVLEEPEGHLLRTFEIVKSEKYWKFVFNLNKFGLDEYGLKARLEYFKRISSYDSPWVICNKCSKEYFEPTKNNKSLMKKWISKKGEYQPPKSGAIRKYLNKNEITGISYILVTVE